MAEEIDLNEEEEAALDEAWANLSFDDADEVQECATCGDSCPCDKCSALRECGGEGGKPGPCPDHADGTPKGEGNDATKAEAFVKDFHPKGMEFEDIDRGIAPLALLPKNQLRAALERMLGEEQARVIVAVGKNKAGVLAELKRKLYDRLESWNRIQFRP